MEYTERHFFEDENESLHSKNINPRLGHMSKIWTLMRKTLNKFEHPFVYLWLNTQMLKIMPVNMLLDGEL
jgi:hypothetical protein